MTIVLSEEDRKELVELYRKAQTTPVIALSTEDMMAGRTWSAMAWDKVRERMKELGKKYGYDPTSPIDPETGEVQTSTPTTKKEGNI